MDETKRDATLFGQARAIYEAGLGAVAPGLLIRGNVAREGNLIRISGESFDLGAFNNVYLIAFGKAAAGMAEAVAEILGDRLTEGVVIAPEPGEYRASLGAETGEASTSSFWRKLEYREAPHPLPDERSVEAAERALALASRAGERDLVIFCISGGGSSLLCLPADGISLAEKKTVTQNLLRAGADIRELNAVRKHLSGVKGGRLAKAAFPATVVSLVVSDVAGDDLEAIASGPAHWDSSTFADARASLEKYGLWESSPLTIRTHIEKGIRGDAPETLKSGDPVFVRVHTFVIGNTLTALLGARREADGLGFEPLILTSSDEGEARKTARDYAAFIVSQACSMSAAPKPLCLLAGGELTVTVKGRGTGGRNMEFVLASLIEFAKDESAAALCPSCGPDDKTGDRNGLPGLEWLVLSIGTDGIDGPTDAAGAWADTSTLERAQELGLDPGKYLAANDSYSFFKKTGNLILTGPTGTNVCDVRIFLMRPVQGSENRGAFPPR